MSEAALASKCEASERDLPISTLTPARRSRAILEVTWSRVTDCVPSGIFQLESFTP